MSRRSLADYQNSHRFAAKIEYRLHGGLAAALGNSRAVVRQLISEGISPSIVGLNYNGVSTEEFYDRSCQIKLRHRLGVVEGAFVIAVVANLIAYKGHSDLLAALGAFKERLPVRWILVCIGADRGIREKLQLQAETLGIHENVRWLGVRSDVPEWLGAADLGVLCSHEEGFANCLLEYMAAALPVVATDVGGNSEAILDGVTGLLVPKGNAELIGRSIVRLAWNENLRCEMGQAGRARVQKLFSLNRCVRNYVQLYEALLDPGPVQVNQILPDPGLK